jgi:MscS family membrane protein
MDQARVYIPNSTVAKAPITNWSRLAKRRLEMTLTVKGNLRGEAVQGLISQFRGALESRARVDRSSVEVVVSEVIGGGVKIRVVAFVLIAGQSEFLREQQQILLNLADLVRAVGAELG